MNIEQLNRGKDLLVLIEQSEKRLCHLTILRSTLETNEVLIGRNSHFVVLTKEVAKAALILQLENERETLKLLQEEWKSL